MLLKQKQLIIEQLEKETGETAVDFHVEPVRHQPTQPTPSKGKYKAVSGDLTDELLAKIINEMNVTLPIARISTGWYLFGTRKLYAKVVGGTQLIVKVGGGYCNMKEYIAGNQQAEL